MAEQGGTALNRGPSSFSFGNRLLASLAVFHGKALVLLKDQRGFLSTRLITIMLVIVLFTSSILAGVAFAARKKAVMTYGWYTEAMDFAAQAANQDGDMSKVALRTSSAQWYFQHAFAKMTAEEKYPGSFTTERFQAAFPGQPVPGGIAQAPGYVSEITVPVLGGDLPFIGPQYITVPMRYFAVVKSQRKY